MTSNRQRLVANGAVIAAVVAIGLATLTPRNGSAPGSPWWCLVCGDLGAVDLLQNIALFVPIGLSLAWRGTAGSRILLSVFLFSITIEAVQLNLIAGRDASLGDVLANSGGGGVGWLMATRWRRWWWPEPGGAAFDHSLIWAGCASAVLALGGWLLTPAYTAEPWFGQLTPSLGHLAQFSGTASDPRLNGAPLPVGGVPIDPASGPTLSLAGRISRTAIVSPRVAPIVSVFGRSQAEVALLGQQGRSLVFRARTRAQPWRLQPIAVGLTGVFAGRAATGFDGMGARRGRELVVAVTENDRTTATILELSPALGWTAFLPVPYTHRHAIVTGTVTAIWLALLMAPLGWFARLRPGTAPVALGLVVLALLGSGPGLGLALPGPLELTGAVAGWAAGWLVCHRLGRPRPPA